MQQFRFLFFLLSCSLCAFTFAQEDSIALTKDTITKDLPKEKVKFKDKKIVKSIRKLIFKKQAKPQVKSDSTKINRISQYLNYQNKKIRNIYIQSNDPFGYSATDSLRKPETRLERLGNSLHGKTKNSIIDDYLLFKEGEVFDSLKVKESERLLRETFVIRRIKISAQPIEGTDELDVFVRTVDSWSMIVTGSASTSKVGLRLRERNFLGVGHLFDNHVRYDFDEKKTRYTGRYFIPNLFKTFVSFNGQYYKDYEEYYNKSVSLQRRFFSPLTRWAGGVALSEQYFKENLDFSEIIDDKMHSFQFSTQDFWGGYAFRIENEHGKYGKVTNLILSARYNSRTYDASPNDNYDPDNFFSSHKLFLAGIGITSRSFYKAQYIFRVGLDEDIPLGRSLMLNIGNEHKNNNDRLYFGAKYTSGNIYKFGYLGTTAEYGTYFNQGNLEQSVFSLQSLYFSNLYHWGTWKFRQFAKTTFVYGYNRFDTQGDMLSLHSNDYLGMVGFNSENLFGTQKAIFSLQSQAYSPWSILGFRVSPFFNATFGMLGTSKDFVLKNKVYPSFSLGVVLTNDFLVFSNLQLSFTFFPTTPGKEDNRFLSNTFQNYDFGYLNYEIGRPETVKWNKWY